MSLPLVAGDLAADVEIRSELGVRIGFSSKRLAARFPCSSRGGRNQRRSSRCKHRRKGVGQIGVQSEIRSSSVGFILMIVIRVEFVRIREPVAADGEGVTTHRHSKRRTQSSPASVKPSCRYHCSHDTDRDKADIKPPAALVRHTEGGATEVWGYRTSRNCDPCRKTLDRVPSPVRCTSSTPPKLFGRADSHRCCSERLRCRRC